MAIRLGSRRSGRDRAARRGERAVQDRAVVTSPFRRAQANALTPGPAPRAAARLVRLFGALLVGILVFAAVLTGGIYLKLRQGPLPLNDFAPAIEEAVNAQLDGRRLEIGGAEIALGDGASPTGLRARDVRLLDEAGDVIVEAPLIGATFRVWDMLSGTAAPETITVEGARFFVTRRIGGALDFGLGAGDDGAGEDDGRTEAAFASVIEALSVGGEGELARLREVGLRRGVVIYRDVPAGREVEVSVDFRLRGGGGALMGEATVSYLDDRDGERARIALTARGEAAGASEARLVFSGVRPANLAAYLPDIGLAAFDAKVGGSLALSGETAGVATVAELRVESGAGVIRAADGAELPFERLALDAGYDLLTRQVEVRSGEVRSDAISFGFSGDVSLTGDGAFVAQVDLTDPQVDLPEVFTVPLDYDAGRIVGRFDMGRAELDIGEAHLVRGDMRLSVSGQAALGGAAPEGEAAFSIEALPLDQLLAHIPRAAAPGAASWMRENMTAATVDAASGVARFGPDGEAFTLRFDFREAVGRYQAQMPPIEGAAGRGEVDLDTFFIAVDEGFVRPEGARAPLDVAGSSFRIPDLADPDSWSEADIVATGRIDDVLRLIDSPPLGFVSRLDLAPDAFTGRAEVRAKIGLPLLKDLELDQVAVDGSATLFDVAGRAPGVDVDVAADRLEMDVDVTRLRLRGDARIGGAPARFAWVETFSPGAGGVRTAVDLTARATPGRLDALGFGWPGFAEGAADLTARLTISDAEGARFTASGDLTDAALRIDEIGWRKAAGARAQVEISGALPEGGPRFDALSLSAPGLETSGRASFTGGALERLSLDAFRFRDGVDLALDISRGPGGFIVDARGAFIDLTKFGDILESGDVGGGVESGAATAVSITLDVDRLKATDALWFGNARGNVDFSDSGAIRAALSGALGGGARADVTFDGVGEGGAATITSGDAGALLRGAGFFNEGIGGRLTGEARLRNGPGGVSMDGRARIVDFLIRDDPALDGLLTRADVEAAGGGGVVFDEIRAPFRLGGGVLHVENGLATGPTVGVRVTGDYHLEANRLDMTGVFTPAYALNSALGKVPILGAILTGGEGRGVFAFNFSVRGSAEDPDISVNPLSGLAPGILRELLPSGGPLPPVQPRSPTSYGDQ